MRAGLYPQSESGKRDPLVVVAHLHATDILERKVRLHLAGRVVLSVSHLRLTLFSRHYFLEDLFNFLDFRFLTVKLVKRVHQLIKVPLCKFFTDLNDVLDLIEHV